MKAYRLILVALLGIMMCSCKKDEPSYYVNDLQALWLENGTQHYVRFTERKTISLIPRPIMETDGSSISSKRTEISRTSI